MQLSIRSGPDRGKVIDIPDEPLVIGRDESCDLVLPDSRVSRRHVELTPAGEGAVALKDLGSGNGTLVNGKRVETYTLKGNEQVQIGDTVLATSIDQPSAPGDATVLGESTAMRSQSTIQRLIIQRSAKRAQIVSAAAIAVALIVGLLLVTGVIGGGDDNSNAVAKVVATASPSTVLIEANRAGKGPASGSGWVLDAAEGLIVTNAHVVNDGETFRAGAGGRLRPATVVAAAPCEDLAVLKIANTAGLKTMPLGTQASLKLGETVVALGYPASASKRADLTSTSGVVSVARSVYREPALDIPLYANVVQTDAAINPGNSGGPLLDLAARLVGVNSAGRTISPGGRIVQGQNYAIGVDRVKEIMRTLRTGRSLGWTGAGFDYNSPADQVGLLPGLVVARTVKGTAAGAAANLLGGVITEVDGNPIDNSLSSYCDAVDGIDSGNPITLTVSDPDGSHTRAVKLRLE